MRLSDIGHRLQIHRSDRPVNPGSILLVLMAVSPALAVVRADDAATRAHAKAVVQRLISAVNRSDWRTVRGLFESRNAAEEVSGCRQRKRKFRRFKVSFENLHQDATGRGIYLIGMRSPDGWAPTAAVSTSTWKITDIHWEDD